MMRRESGLLTLVAHPTLKSRLRTNRTPLPHHSAPLVSRPFDPDHNGAALLRRNRDHEGEAMATPKTACYLSGR